MSAVLLSSILTVIGVHEGVRAMLVGHQARRWQGNAGPSDYLASQERVTAELEFLTPNIATVRGFLPVPECAETIAAMDAAPREAAQVVRAGESILDQSLRFCFDHHLPEDFKDGVGERMARYFGRHCGRFESDADYLYGPYFMSYEQGSYFRAHRDVANHKNDPARLAAHRWSLLLYLNGRDRAGMLPAFDGGALIVYETDPSVRDRRVVIVPEPGMLVLFRSALLHEVAILHGGTRYAVAGWMATSTDRAIGAHQ
jgi:Rps23 Pro-64 3,4-dihydroxylase Tpa1-like proline 4-hydroxylase